MVNYEDKYLLEGRETTPNTNQTLINKHWYYSTASQTRLKALAEFKTWYFEQMKPRTWMLIALINIRIETI